MTTSIKVKLIKLDRQTNIDKKKIDYKHEDTTDYYFEKKNIFRVYLHKFW